MQRALLHEGIEFHLFEAIRGANTLLVARGHVARGRHSCGLGFGAFEDDDVSRHKFWGAEARLLFAKVKRLSGVV